MSVVRSILMPCLLSGCLACYPDSLSDILVICSPVLMLSSPVWCLASLSPCSSGQPHGVSPSSPTSSSRTQSSTGAPSSLALRPSPSRAEWTCCEYNTEQYCTVE